jgi:hypothetical protein
LHGPALTRSPRGNTASIRAASPLPASSRKVPCGTATRVAHRQRGGVASSPDRIRNPRHSVAKGAIFAGVDLNPITAIEQITLLAI